MDYAALNDIHTNKDSRTHTQTYSHIQARKHTHEHTKRSAYDYSKTVGAVFTKLSMIQQLKKKKRERREVNINKSNPLK